MGIAGAYRRLESGEFRRRIRIWMSGTVAIVLGVWLAGCWGPAPGGLGESHFARASASHRVTIPQEGFRRLGRNTFRESGRGTTWGTVRRRGVIVFSEEPTDPVERDEAWMSYLRHQVTNTPGQAKPPPGIKPKGISPERRIKITRPSASQMDANKILAWPTREVKVGEIDINSRDDGTNNSFGRKVFNHELCFIQRGSAWISTRDGTQSLIVSEGDLISLPKGLELNYRLLSDDFVEKVRTINR
ncbi:hypothetical protein AAMO2058_000892700 [Amorphochlora amoebiformis]